MAARRGAALYLAQPAIVGVVVGCVFLGSAFTARPLAGLVAADLLHAPATAETTPAFRHAFRVVTLVWAAYLLVRALGRLAVLAFVSVEWFLVVTAVSGAPVMAVLALWSGAYALRAGRGDPTAAWLVEGLVEAADLGS